jgi:hypothetical protein
MCCKPCSLGEEIEQISESNGMAFPRFPIGGSPFTFKANVVANSPDKMRTEEQEITIISLCTTAFCAI